MNFIEGYPSENRAVLHTAIRDFSKEKNSSEIVEKAKKDSKKGREKLQSFMQKIDREKKFSEMICIGTGPSGGDHFNAFNAGFLAASAFDLSLQESLLMGVAAS